MLQYTKHVWATALVAFGMVALAAPPPVYEIAGTEFDSNRAGLTTIFIVAVAVITAFVAIRLLRKGGGQVR